MRRPIKFRVWDGKNYIDPESITTNLDANGGMYCQEDDWSGLSIDDDEAVIFEQFTGLLDKNGKEIYEGDIVVIDEDHDNVRGVLSTEGATLMLNNQPLVYVMTCSCGSDLSEYAMGQEDMLRVIGNIHENPELL